MPSLAAAGDFLDAVVEAYDAARLNETTDGWGPPVLIDIVPAPSMTSA